MSRRKYVWAVAIIVVLLWISWQLQWRGLLGAILVGALVVGCWSDDARQRAKRRRSLRIGERREVPGALSPEEAERVRKLWEAPYR